MTFSGLQAIVFDFDGVLVESVDLKGQAFVALYGDESESIRQEVLAYHEAHGGMTRYEKIRHYETLCGRRGDEESVAVLAARFAEIVEAQVVAAPWVAGAGAFLERYHDTIPLYVASATPQEELERIIEKRGMAPFFKRVYGAPAKKHEALLNIAAANRYDPQVMLMVGDAMTDRDAAEKAGTRFVGRIAPDHGTSVFPAGTSLIHDLTELDRFVTLS